VPAVPVSVVPVAPVVPVVPAAPPVVPVAPVSPVVPLVPEVLLGVVAELSGVVVVVVLVVSFFLQAPSREAMMAAVSRSFGAVVNDFIVYTPRSRLSCAADSGEAVEIQRRQVSPAMSLS
jgi:hypothetical protein